MISDSLEVTGNVSDRQDLSVVSMITAEHMFDVLLHTGKLKSQKTGTFKRRMPQSDRDPSDKVSLHFYKQLEYRTNMLVLFYLILTKAVDFRT